MQMQAGIPNHRLIAIVRFGFVVLAGSFILLGLAGLAAYWGDAGHVCTLSDFECQTRDQFTVAQAAAFSDHGIPLQFMVLLRYGGLAAGMLAAVIVGLVIAWRRSDSWMALLTSLFLISYIASNGGVLGSLTRAVPALTDLVLIAESAWAVLLVPFLALFPNGRPTPSWTRILVPLGMLGIVVMSTIAKEASTQPALLLFMAVGMALLLGSLLGAQVIRYRRYATPSERQQVKWGLFGIALFVILLLSAVALVLLLPPTTNLVIQFLVGYVGFNLGPALLPIFIGIAILRSRLFDIDLIIRRTLIYGLSTVLLAFVYFGSVTLLQRALSFVTGPQSELAIVVSTLAIAVMAIPLRNRIQGVIDRRFYRSKYDAAKVLARFGEKARDEVDIEKLRGELLDVVEETMQPVGVSLWLVSNGDGKGREAR